MLAQNYLNSSEGSHEVVFYQTEVESSSHNGKFSQYNLISSRLSHTISTSRGTQCWIFWNWVRGLLGSCPITLKRNHRIITRDFPKMQKKSSLRAAALYRNAPCTQSKCASAKLLDGFTFHLKESWAPFSPDSAPYQATLVSPRPPAEVCGCRWKEPDQPPLPVNASLQSAAGASIKLSMIDTGQDGKGSSK